jgi:hypothetical protein
MYKFLVKLFGFSIFSFFIFFIIFLIYDSSLKFEKKFDTYYVWGDSQMDQGVNLQMLRNKLGISVMSSAQHGAGIYDFLTFTDRVPENSNVLISCSSTFLLRNKKRDRNESGISFFALKNLLMNHYSFFETKDIFVNNLKIKTPVKVENSLYKVSDSLTIQEKFSDLSKIYYHLPLNNVFDKQNLYLSGIDELKKKNCRIIVVVFPFHSRLKNIEENSNYKIFRDKLHKSISFKLKSPLDTLKLNHSSQMMYDYTHLNSNGANQLTISLVNELKKNKKNSMLIFI